MRLLLLTAAALSACAGTRVSRDPPPAPAPLHLVSARPLAVAQPVPARLDPAPPAPATPVDPSAPVAFGSEDPEGQGGTWIPPELHELVARLEPTAGRPSRVTWIGGSTTHGCDETWRFRLIYGSYDRFANLAAFRTREAARSCAARFKERHGKDPAQWAKLEPLQHRAGPYFVVFTGTLEGDAQLRSEVVKALEELRFEQATAVPRDEIPSGANPRLYQRNRARPPPPLRR